MISFEIEPCFGTRKRYEGIVGCYYFLAWVLLYMCGRGKVDFVITGTIESYALANEVPSKMLKEHQKAPMTLQEDTTTLIIGTNSCSLRF